MLALTIRGNGDLCRRKRPSFMKVRVVFRHGGFIQGFVLTAAEGVKPSIQSFRGRLEALKVLDVLYLPQRRREQHLREDEQELRRS